MKLRQSYATALCAAALLATQAGAQSTLAAKPALTGQAVGGTGDQTPVACL